MMKITGLSHLFKWENLHNLWLTKYFFAPLYMVDLKYTTFNCVIRNAGNCNGLCRAISISVFMLTFDCSISLQGYG